MTFNRLDFSGRDAGSFLQAQLATDLRSVNEGQWLWAALLSLKGRVLALGPLGRLQDTHWRWLLASDLAEASAQHLRRYQLRSKLSIESAAQACAAVMTTLAAATVPGPHAIVADADTTMRWQGFAPGFDLLLDPPADRVDASNWAQCTLARLRSGRALIEAASSDRHLPAALSLLEDSTVSVRKGCYPGQEIVARTHFLGRNKRVRCLLQGDLPVPGAGQSVQAADQIVGEVVEAGLAGDRYLALAVVEESSLGHPLQIEGRTAEIAGPSTEVSRVEPPSRSTP